MNFNVNNMQSLKSKILLNLMLHSHIFRFQLKRKPFDPSMEGIRKMRERVEQAANRFGKLPKETVIDELNINGRYAEWVRLPGNHAEKAMLYFHGGMYLLGSPQSHRQHVVKFVQGTGVNALVFDYRLAPEYSYPSALEDALAAYQYLLDEGYKPSNIIFAGDSAGGGLCLATLLALKDKGIALPAAAAALSPWTDLLLTGRSYKTNMKKCFAPIGCPQYASEFYAKGHDRSNPYISPLYGDLKGLPPLHISAGGNEILLDDAIRFAYKAKDAGVPLTLRVDKGMCHCYPAFGNLFRESKLALAEICEHLRRYV
ncbi:MAG TPA: alpha/beta hydrolase [Bacteroidales bacterium]